MCRRLNANYKAPFFELSILSKVGLRSELSESLYGIGSMHARGV